MSLDDTRASWNAATARHNTHKGDQAAFLRAGGDVLFPEELALLGAVDGLDLVHLQCNAGQDSLCLARRGARVTGVDLSDVAIDFARRLSADAGIPARFHQAEIVAWMQQTDQRFDVAFASYGALPWNRDIAAWMAGAHRVLRPGGRLVVVEFHPVAWSLGDALDLRGDDYFDLGPFVDPVSDYVAETLGVDTGGPPLDIPATAWQHTLAALLQAVIDSGLRLVRIEEYPHSNYARLSAGLVRGPGRTWVLPEGRARVPLMVGFVAERTAEG